jgi:hypothetical protein
VLLPAGGCEAPEVRLVGATEHLNDRIGQPGANGAGLQLRGTQRQLRTRSRVGA